MKENKSLPDGQSVQSEELKQVKEELRRVKREKHFMAMRLRTHDKRKAEMKTKMRRIAATAQQVGKVRIIDINAVSAEERSQYLGLVQCAALCGTTYVTMIKWLQAEGIIVREGNVWVVGSDYQQSGLFVYLSGVGGSYTRFYLKVTPAGVPFIGQMLARHPRKEAMEKPNMKE